MSDISPKISDGSPKISDGSSAIANFRMSGSSVDDVRAMLAEGVERPGVPRKQAVPMLAREVRVMSARRILAILHGEVQRLWDDEAEAVRRWYVEFLRLEAERAQRRAEALLARRARLDAGDGP